MVTISSDVRLHGIFLEAGVEVEEVNPATGAQQLDFLEDERQYDSAQIEREITAPDSNRKILEAIKRYADAYEAEYGRFPKTLVFAVNDLTHTSHADQLVTMARDVFGRGEGFVAKITGRVDRPPQRIREFRNRPQPAVAVTVDLLSNRLVWYAVNIAKLAVHGIDRTEVMDVVETDAWVPDRHPAYPNQVRVIGPTRHGRLLTVVLEETDDPTSWRPVTGWPADRDEETYDYEATQ